jgi:hypothetical protein
MLYNLEAIFTLLYFELINSFAEQFLSDRYDAMFGTMSLFKYFRVVGTMNQKKCL